MRGSASRTSGGCSPSSPAIAALAASSSSGTGIDVAWPRDPPSWLSPSWLSRSLLSRSCSVASDVSGSSIASAAAVVVSPSDEEHPAAMSPTRRNGRNRRRARKVMALLVSVLEAFSWAPGPFRPDSGALSTTFRAGDATVRSLRAVRRHR